MAAALFTFTSTCQRLGVEPWAYLQDVLTRLPTTPTRQLGCYLPDHWLPVGQVKEVTPPSAATDATNPSAEPSS